MNCIRLFILLYIFALGVIKLSGQDWYEFINSKDNYGDIIHQINRHFGKTGTGRGSGYKQYRRWKHEMDMQYRPNEPMKDHKLELLHTINDYQRVKSNKEGSRSTTGLWEPIGPFTAPSSTGLGRLNCIKVHPTDPNTIWVGAPNGGLWKTTDGGVSWTTISNYYPMLGVSSIEVDPTNPNIIYVLTGDGDGRNSRCLGVMKSIDGGLNWSLKTFDSFPFDSYGFKLKISPSDPDELYACTTRGLYFSNDAGENWVPFLTLSEVWDMEFKPGNSDIFYLATNLGVMKYSFTTLTTLNVGLPAASSYARASLEVSTHMPNNIYVLFGGDSDAGMFNGFYLSVDGGTSFGLMSNTPNILGWFDGGDDGNQAGYDLTLEVDPLNGSRILVGGINCWRSTNGGINWTKVTSWNGSPFVHADFHHIEYFGSTLYACSDGGIFKSNDHGSNWTEITNGINIMQFYFMDFHNDSWMGGTQDNGTNTSTVGNMQLSKLHGGDGFGCTWHNTNHSIQFFTSQNEIVRRQYGTNLFINQADNGFWFSSLKMSKNGDGHLFVNRGNELFKGNQVTLPHDWTWPARGTAALLTDDIRGYVQGQSNTNVMFVLAFNKIIKSTNIYSSSPTWEELTNPAPTAILQNITIDPLNENRIWLVCSGFTSGQKVFRSIDGGITWTNISGSLPNVQIRCIVYEGSGSDKLYIGTDLGVFYRGPLMTDWLNFSNYLPTTLVNDMSIESGYIYAATFGRGMWRSPVYTSCPTNLILNPANDPSTVYTQGQQIHYASSSITNNRVITGSQTETTYIAGNRIDFTEGFHAKDGTKVIARIGGCPD